MTEERRLGLCAGTEDPSVDYLRLIDTNTPGPRYDVTPLFADYEAFSFLVEDLLEGFIGVEFDCVVGIDALGFILGTAVAMLS